MTKAEVMKMVEGGAIVCVGMYWSGRLEKITMRSTVEGGPRREAYVAREIVMTDKDPIVISRFLPDSEKPENWKPSAKKNDAVVCIVTTMESQNGQVVLSGTIEPLV